MLWLCNRQTSRDQDSSDWQWNDNDVAIPLRSDKRQREYIDNRGIHVVVGRYVGDQLPGKHVLFLSSDVDNMFLQMYTQYCMQVLPTPI